MILVIRIAGMVKVAAPVTEALHRMRLRRKYAAVLIQDNIETRALLDKVRNYVAYGPVADETLIKLLSTRGVYRKKGEFDAAKIATQLKTKTLEEVGFKPFFRLHSPRGGIDSKKHYGLGKGVLGDNKEGINKLVEKML